MIRRGVVMVAIVAAGALAGCQKPVHFPAVSMTAPAKSAGAFDAYDVRGKGFADFYLFTGPDGRINRLGFDYSHDPRSMQVVDLDRLDKKDFRHLVIILDGFGYDVVKNYYDHGGLRMFYPPSRVIATYPTLTDLCLEDAFGYIPCLGFEAQYFSHEKNQVVGGTSDYLKGVNEPYVSLLQYRASMLVDAFAYLAPWPVFGHEFNEAKRVFDRRDRQEVIVYSVGSAGVSTREGVAGQRKCLEQVDQFVKQILWESHGEIRITMFADHGHAYTPATRIPLESFLERRGWRLVESLTKPRDVAYIRFGLETYASFAAHERKELAEDLIQAEGVDLASYAEKDMVVVLGRGGQKAIVRHRDQEYAYEPIHGDPLRLKATLATLAGKDGFYDEQDLFRATLTSDYPAALQRLWRAHFDLVKDPADVIASLEDKYYSGSRGFDAFINVASTHGSLNRSNSTTFIMSTVAPLAPAMTSRDIPANMLKMTGQKFPSRK